MSAPRALLPLVLSLSALATLGGGVLAAEDLRAEERRERAAAAERRAAEQERLAVVAHQQAVRPLADAVYDLAQPLQQAHGDLDRGEVSTVDVLMDVGAHVNSPAALPALRRQLGDVVPPVSLRDAHRVLILAVDDLAYAGELASELDDAESEDSYVVTLSDSGRVLDDATGDWIRSIGTIFKGAQAPPVPVASGTAGSRAPLSHASYLREAGNQCSAGIAAFAKVGGGEEPSLPQLRAGLKELSTRVPALLRVKAPMSDDRLVAASIRAHLRRAAEIGQGFEAALAAARRGDAAGLRAGRERLARGQVAAQRAADGYRAYGSRLCALYLVGLEDDAVAGDDTSAT